MQRQASMTSAGDRSSDGGGSTGRYQRSDDAYEAGICWVEGGVERGTIDVGVHRPGAGSFRTSEPWIIYMPLSTEQVNNGVTASSLRNISSTGGVRVTTCPVSDVKRETALLAEFF